MGMTLLYLPSAMPKASAEKSQSLGLTQQVGTRVTWELAHSHIWHLEDLKTRVAISSTFMWPLGEAWLPHNMAASGESGSSPAGSGLPR